ncbi:MAG: hypothetical protein SF187_02355 [Deltaproteobacteria bacterium]|nr:hypothetical protein [Deltaproteobacteria bacterium]
MDDLNRAIPPMSFSRVTIGGDSTTPSYACAVSTQGRLACWGDSLPASSPILGDVPDGTGFRSIAAGREFVCVLEAGGRPVCWGKAPGEAPNGQFVSIGASKNNACGATAEGKIQCWGAISGIGDAFPRNPTYIDVVGASDSDTVCALTMVGQIACVVLGRAVVLADKGPFEELTVGRDHACAIRRDRTVMCWDPATGALKSDYDALANLRAVAR